jgi:outer membrane lipoprotein SlyB
MIKIINYYTIILTLSILTSSCSTWRKLNNTEKGGTIGGGSGILIGAAVGGPIGAVIGGAAGAFGGAVVGSEAK